MRHRAVRRTLLTAVALLSSATAFSACDTADRIRSKVVAINLLLDLGDPFDLAPRHVEAVANFMTISGSLDDPTAEPIAGAVATLEIENVATTITMDEDSDGVYRASSGTGGNPALVYTSGADYTIRLVVASGKQEGTYTTKIAAPPRTEVAGLPDTGNGETHPANTDLAVTLTGSYDKGLVVVVDSSGNVVYDSRPSDVQSAVDFVFGDFDGTITIPGSAFPNAGTAYGLIIAGLDSAPSGGISTNLNIVSRFYAGSGKTAIVVTSP